MAGRVAGPWSQILDTAAPAFSIDGQTFVLPDHRAAEWLRALASDDPEDVLPGLLADEDQERWADLYFADDAWGAPLVSIELREQIVNQLITEAAGMPYTAALALLGWAGEGWRHFDAWCAERQVDPLAMHLDRLCNLIYRMLYESKKDESARMAFDATLFQPPPDADPDDPTTLPAEWSAESQAAMFQAALAQQRPTNRRLAPTAPVV